MRKLIDIVEVRTEKYYHGSNDKLPVGTILNGRGAEYEAHWMGSGFYEILEKYRPPNMLSHKDAVFMCDNPDDIDVAGGGTEWLFTLLPLGKVERHDLNWSSEIDGLVSMTDDDEDDFDTLEDNEKRIREAAVNYWNGVPHHSESVWEYLTPSAKILKVEKY